MQKLLCCLVLALHRFLAIIFHYITVDMKQRTLQLTDLGWNTNKIAAILSVLAKGIGRWEGNYATHGIVNPKSPLCSCLRILNTEIVEGLHQLIKETPSCFLNEWLAL